MSTMKTCAYCGCKSDDSLSICPQCGLSLAPVRSGSLRDLAQRLETPLGRPLTSSLGSLLISTGIYLMICGVCTLRLNTLAASEIGPSSFLVVFLAPRLALPTLAATTALLVFYVCKRRCQERWHASVTATITGAILLPPAFPLSFIPTAQPLLSFALLATPAYLLGLLSASTVGLCLGAGFQIVLGMWLLGWFGQPRNCESAPTS